MRDLRLYCGEPALVRALSLGLHSATQPHGTRDLAHEQDDAIDEAMRRADAWEVGRLRAALQDRRPRGSAL